MVNRKNIEKNLSLYKKALAQVDVCLECSNAALKVRSKALQEAAAGESPQLLLPEAFSLVNLAVKRALGITPHAVQLLAAIAMSQGRIVELATGEGKTIVAVFVAYLAALSGAGVHVLTANDYLAERDALWMGPVYDLLGISAGNINEQSDFSSRKAAYEKDVTYLTAKEAGFDYLRGFLAYAPCDIAQKSLNYAVIDEADSIMIDEARIPMVIGSGVSGEKDSNKRIVELVSSLELGADVGIDDHGSVIYLEERGISKLEEILCIESLYDEANLELLEKINATLKAVFLLKRDVDYIVRGGEVFIVDQITGRVAENRQWSDGIQTAVEIKEQLRLTDEGCVLNKISFQNLLQLYSSFSGMTGTAQSAAAEFLRFYNTPVTIIPPNVPCIREDLPDVIFAAKEGKMLAVAKEIAAVHATGQPILVGTSSIKESEQLAAALAGRVRQVNVLNAKNDHEEAKLIAQAGMPYAVTISTNMAGRGVDIPLGGLNGSYARQVKELGGLYIIGTNRYESARIDNQLRGRAGRQGDPGKSKFYVSLEDDLYDKYGLREIIPEDYRRSHQNEPLKNKAVIKAVERMQDIVEVQTFDAKITLFKYARVLEDQRLAVHSRRMDILHENAVTILKAYQPELEGKLLHLVGRDELDKLSRKVELYSINKCWSNYLLYTDSVMEEIGMISATRGDPLVYYNKKLIEGFKQLEESTRRTVAEIFESAEARDGHIILDAEEIMAPTSTTTYLVHDGSEQFDSFGMGGSALASAAFAAPLFLFSLLFEKLKGNSNNKG